LIRINVDREFDRVAAAFSAHAALQPEPARAGTLRIVEILEEKRAETMANPRAGYYIRDWQELTDQVRQMIFKDPRYQTIKGGLKR
jgi:hypothetical protein